MTRNQSGGFRRLPRIADKMTTELLACNDRSLAAERAGDAAAALEWHLSVPMFRRGRHGNALELVDSFGGVMPEWMWARWIAYQAVRCEDGDTGRDHHLALRSVANTLHEDLLARCFDEQGDPVQVAARIAGESWLFHQVRMYESLGIESFIDEFAAGQLAEHADLARQWSDARMSGFEIGASRPGARLEIREAGGAAWFEVLDLGAGVCARSCARRADAVIGRLVPSGVGDLLMFDMPPLGVPKKLAGAVAASGDEWLRPIAGEVAARGSSRFLMREDYELGTDVLELDLVRFGTAAGERDRVMQELRSGKDEVRKAAFRVLRSAADGDLSPADQAYVAAAALNPRARDDVHRKLVRAGHPEPWVTWAARMPNPARGLLLGYAEAARASA